MKLKLSYLVPTLILMAAIPSPLLAGQIGKIERDAAGNVLKLNQPQAAVYCKNLNQRLPSAREYAQFAEQNGARVRETAFPGKPFDFAEVRTETDANQREKFYPVGLLNGETHEEGFYFYLNTEKYQAPNDEPSKSRFWTATVLTPPPLGDNLADMFWGSSGSINIMGRDSLGAVRCALRD